MISRHYNSLKLLYYIFNNCFTTAVDIMSNSRIVKEKEVRIETLKKYSTLIKEQQEIQTNISEHIKYQTAAISDSFNAFEQAMIRRERKSILSM